MVESVIVNKTCNTLEELFASLSERSAANAFPARITVTFTFNCRLHVFYYEQP